MTLCWALLLWQMTVKTRALRIWRQWWLQFLHLTLGTQRWRVPISCLCFVIDSRRIVSMRAGSVLIRTSSAVVGTDGSVPTTMPSWNELVSASAGIVSRGCSSFMDGMRLRWLSRCLKEGGRMRHEPVRCLGLPWSNFKLFCIILSMLTCAAFSSDSCCTGWGFLWNDPLFVQSESLPVCTTPSLGLWGSSVLLATPPPPSSSLLSYGWSYALFQMHTSTMRLMMVRQEKQVLEYEADSVSKHMVISLLSWHWTCDQLPGEPLSNSTWHVFKRRSKKQLYSFLRSKWLTDALQQRCSTLWAKGLSVLFLVHSRAEDKITR